MTRFDIEEGQDSAEDLALFVERLPERLDAGKVTIYSDHVSCNTRPLQQDGFLNEFMLIIAHQRPKLVFDMLTIKGDHRLRMIAINRILNSTKQLELWCQSFPMHNQVALRGQEQNKNLDAIHFHEGYENSEHENDLKMILPRCLILQSNSRQEETKFSFLTCQDY